jgi:two-component sensor histidine kinase
LNLKFLKNRNPKSPAFERSESLFLFFTYLTLLLISFYFMFIYFKYQSYIYFYTEILCIAALAGSMILLIKGLTQFSIGVTFVLYGNFFLLRAVIFQELIMFEYFPFSPEIYYAFQAIIIITVGYFSQKIQGVIVTVIFGFTFNILHVTFNYSNWLNIYILSSIMFIILPSIFSFYIFRSKQLLYKYYNSNFNKNREINHRIKNQLNILSSMIGLKNATNIEINNTDKSGLQTIIDSFISVYDLLLISENVHSVNLFNYMEDLLTKFSISLPLETQLMQKNREICISSEKIIHFGMICAELITNSLKFAETEDLVVTVKIDTVSSHLVFQYSDSGEQKPIQISTTGFGQSIIKMIVEENLGGKSEIDYTKEYSFTASIPLSTILIS